MKKNQSAGSNKETSGSGGKSINGGPVSDHTTGNGKYFGTKISTNYPDNIDASLISPVIDLTDTKNPILTFWQWTDFEGFIDNADGGILEILTIENGILEPVPPDKISPSYDNLLEGKPSYTYTRPFWIRINVNLDSYRGNTIRIKFRFISDDTMNSSGWYIDDISVIDFAEEMFLSPKKKSVIPTQLTQTDSKVTKTPSQTISNYGLIFEDDFSGVTFNPKIWTTYDFHLPYIRVSNGVLYMKERGYLWTTFYLDGSKKVVVEADLYLQGSVKPTTEYFYPPIDYFLAFIELRGKEELPEKPDQLRWGAGCLVKGNSTFPWNELRWINWWRWFTSEWWVGNLCTVGLYQYVVYDIYKDKDYHYLSPYIGIDPNPPGKWWRYKIVYENGVTDLYLAPIEVTKEERIVGKFVKKATIKEVLFPAVRIGLFSYTTYSPPISYIDAMFDNVKVYGVLREEIITTLTTDTTIFYPYKDELGGKTEVKIFYELSRDAYVDIEIRDANNVLLKKLYKEPLLERKGKNKKIWCGVIDAKELKNPDITNDKGVIIARDGKYKIVVIATDVINPDIKDEKFEWVYVRSH